MALVEVESVIDIDKDCSSVVLNSFVDDKSSDAVIVVLISVN